MSLTYILIDFENVKPKAEEWKAVIGNDYRVLIFHGSHQNKFDSDMVNTLQPMGERAEYIRCERRGKNALDFRMAFHLGRLVQALPSESMSPKEKPAFAVVSKDGDLDRLLEYIQALGFKAGRGPTIRMALKFELPKAERSEAGPEARKVTEAREQVPAVAKKPGAPADKKEANPALSDSASAKAQDMWSHVVKHLRDHPNNRPATRAALERHLKAMLGVGATDESATKMAAKLLSKRVVILKDKKLEYVFSEEAR